LRPHLQWANSQSENKFKTRLENFKPGRELLLILHLRISNIDSVSGITYHAWPKLPLVLTILVRGQFSSYPLAARFITQNHRTPAQTQGEFSAWHIHCG
jgi:hypothetical protein